MRTYRTEDSSHRGNQVGVRHLAAWVFGCALGFAAYRGLMPPWPMPVKTRILSGAYNLAMGSAFGTILTGTGVLISRRLRGDRSYPDLPGHWLLIFGLAAALADIAAVVVFRLLLIAWSPHNTSMWAYWLPYRMAQNRPDLAGMYSQCVGWGLGTVAALTFCWHLRRRVQWNWYTAFLVFLLTGMVLAAGAICVTVMFYGPARWGPALVWYRNSIHLYASFLLLGTLAILAAIARDYVCRRPADGLHWAGVAAWLAVGSIQVVTYVSLFAR